MNKNKMAIVSIIAGGLLASGCASNEAQSPNTIQPQGYASQGGEDTELIEKAPATAAGQESASNYSNKVKAPSVELSKEGADPRINFVSNLIYRSHGAEQVKSSNNPEAIALQKEAVSLYEQAKVSADPAASKGLLDKAIEKMFQAVKLSVPSDVRHEKQRADYLKRKESVEALLSAQNRVAEEKKLGNDNQKLQVQVAELMSRADALFDDKQYAQAQGILNGAYEMVKTSVEHMRGGDTLVRSLEFATKAEEYDYEVDRNDTHLMLINVLLAEKMKDESKSAKINSYIDSANSLRENADKSAKSGDYEKAIELIEKSTKELVKAIRRGGVYIPG